MPDDVETNVTKALMVLAKDCHERIIIAGHSQGGAWAQIFASRLKTSFIKKVYVVSTGAFPCFTNIEDATSVRSMPVLKKGIVVTMSHVNDNG